jgi:two-component system, sensor histidine kinase and response regulator
MARQQRILAVDDNSMNCEIIQEILGDEFDVLMASDGHEALVLAERYRPRVVLLDVMLPGLDGYFVCRKRRGMPGMNDVRIVMVSAKAMPSEQAQGFDAGADAYVTKPFDDADLWAAIRPTEITRTRPFELEDACHVH